jgi:DNA-binding NtrC family response regulator
MSGREVLNELRRIRPDVKVILTTAYSQENALSAIGEHRPWSYVRKPYQFSDLLNLLRKACIEKSQARSNTAS